MINIQFEVTDLPPENQKDDLISGFEGLLSISVTDTLFFYSHGILLIEFGIYLSKWLEAVKAGETVNLIYKTMDYDQEPILTIIHVEDSAYVIDSVWKEQSVYEPLKKEVFIDAFEKYLVDLDNQMQIRLGVRLEDVYGWE